MMPARLPSIACGIALGIAVLPAALSAGPPYEGRSLRAVLAELEREGIPLVYSSDLVGPEARVRAEPTSGSIQGVLEELLAPHRLAPEIGPRGHILIVRREARPIEIRFDRPAPGSW